jgi:hypothetical protein
MSDLLQITTPILPKDYQQQPKMQQPQSDQNFNIADTSKIIKTNERTEEYTNQDLSDSQGLAFPKTQTAIFKDPSISSSFLQSLIGEDMLNKLKESADDAMLAELTKFASEIMLSPDKLMQDIMNQQSNTTVFSNALFSILKNLSETGSNEFQSAVLNFFKASASAVSQEEILKSISANLKYLSDTLAPSKALAQQLNDTADSLNSQTFQELKGKIASLLNLTAQSLLLDDKTRNLIPLVTYNMSRINSSAESLGKNFAALLNFISDDSLKEQLKNLFADFVENSSISADAKLSLLNQSGIGTLALITEKLAHAIKSNEQAINPNALSQSLSGANTSRGTASIRYILSLVLPSSSRTELEAVLKDFDSTKNLNALVDRLGRILNSVDSMDIKLPLAQSLNEVLEKLAQQNGINYRPPTSMDNFIDFIAKNLNDPTMHMAGAINQNSLISGILSTPGVFMPLLHFLLPLEADGLRAFGELWADPDAENVSDDKKGGGNSADEAASHMFLCFDVENTGYFELELYAKGKNLNVMLLCPSGLEQQFSPIKKSISEIVSANGYTISNTVVGSVKVKRELSQVFPKINERRNGFNVKI